MVEDLSDILIEELDNLLISYSGNGDNPESNTVLVRRAGRELKKRMAAEINNIVASYVETYESEWA
jgi:hypothetical protein